VFGFLRRKPLGARGEDHAARFLRAQGYRILDRNVQLGKYEIDIIAQEGDTVAFVEVKTRAETGSVRPEENVNHEKQRRIIAGARKYISEADDAEMFYRFDIVAVVLPEKGQPEITLFRDAFRE
jgi:putative endonuclease